MKEIKTSNYHIEISALEYPVNQHIEDTWYVRINHALRFSIVPRLPSKWPATYLEAEDVTSAEDAARFVVATTSIVVTPWEGNETTIETFVDAEITDLIHTIIRVSATRYEDLIADVDRMYSTPHQSDYRLDDLGDRPLARFIREDLPGAAMSTVVRETLCLDRP